MTSDTQHTESGSSIGRRTFIKGIGAAGATGVGLSGRAPGGLSPVGSADALPPVVVGGIAGAAVVGRFVREMDLLTADSPTDGLGPDALNNQLYQFAKRRKSNNASTLVDNTNLSDGVTNTAYTDGKIAAIEKLNEEVSLEEVQSAADDAAAEYLTTVQKNLLKSWNESVDELQAMAESVEESSLGNREVFPNNTTTIGTSRDDAVVSPSGFGSETETLPNGEDFEVKYPALLSPANADDDEDGSEGTNHTPINENVSNQISGLDNVYEVDPEIRVRLSDVGTITYLKHDEWNEIWEQLVDAENEVLGGLQNWTANVYSEVQSGSIDVADLLTPREQAELLADDEEYPQAVADLIALNIPVDPDREATISFTERDITISGLMAPTSPPEEGLNVGETYDPSAEPWDLYFTYDPSRGSGGWSEYEELIAEGELRFTEEPYADLLYRVPTNLGTVEVVSDDFEEVDGGLWAADVSEQLGRTTEEWTDYQTGIDGGTVTFESLPDEAAEFDITTNQGDTETVAASDFEADGDEWTVDTSLGIAEVESVTAHIDRATIEEAISIYSEDGSANYETVQIREEFTLDRLEDSDGNEVESAEFSRTEPQDDENYITQEEWDELEQQNQELIDKYEEAAGSDDGLFGGGGFDFGEFGEVPAGATAAAAGVAVVVVIIGVLRQVASFYLPGR